jgi:hypothetical protein
MRMHLLLAALCSSLILNACAQGKKTAKSSSDKSTTTQSTGTAKPGRDITAMTMRRTGCFGRCPIYEVQLFYDGRAKYIGERFTNYLGTYEKNVGAANVQALLRRAESLRVDTCAETYEMMVQDLPTINFTFSRPQGTQTIQNANYGARYFVGLAADMDSLVKVDGTWRKTAAAKAD